MRCDEDHDLDLRLDRLVRTLADRSHYPFFWGVGSRSVFGGHPYGPCGVPCEDNGLTLFAAIRPASRGGGAWPAARRPGSSSKLNIGERLPVSVADDEAGA
jgi:hypothetical protein